MPERIRWAVAGIGLPPGARVLEVGCGRGVAVALISERLVDGSVTGVDRSAHAVAQASARNAAAVRAGRVVIREASLADLDPAAGRFHRVLAVNVNAFWLERAAQALEQAVHLVAPGGSLHLVFESPSPAQADRVGDRIRTVTGSVGLGITIARGRTRRRSVLLGFRIEPA